MYAVYVIYGVSLKCEVYVCRVWRFCVSGVCVICMVYVSEMWSINIYIIENGLSVLDMVLDTKHIFLMIQFLKNAGYKMI